MVSREPMFFTGASPDDLSLWVKAREISRAYNGKTLLITLLNTRFAGNLMKALQEHVTLYRVNLLAGFTQVGSENTGNCSQFIASLHSSHPNSSFCINLLDGSLRLNFVAKIPGTCGSSIPITSEILAQIWKACQAAADQFVCDYISKIPDLVVNYSQSTPEGFMQLVFRAGKALAFVAFMFRGEDGNYFLPSSGVSKTPFTKMRKTLCETDLAQLPFEARYLSNLIKVICSFWIAIQLSPDVIDSLVYHVFIKKGYTGASLPHDKEDSTFHCFWLAFWNCFLTKELAVLLSRVDHTFVDQAIAPFLTPRLCALADFFTKQNENQFLDWLRAAISPDTAHFEHWSDAALSVEAAGTEQAVLHVSIPSSTSDSTAFSLSNESETSQSATSRAVVALLRDQWVRFWLSSIGSAYEQYADRFVENGLTDAALVKDISSEDLEHLGVTSSLHKKILLWHASKLDV